MDAPDESCTAPEISATLCAETLKQKLRAQMNATTALLRRKHNTAVDTPMRIEETVTKASFYIAGNMNQLRGWAIKTQLICRGTRRLTGHAVVPKIP
jgi:hypothetical protein